MVNIQNIVYHYIDINTLSVTDDLYVQIGVYTRFFPQKMLCSRHLVKTSLSIVLRTLTNNYFLLFSPFTIYRWKNPQYKFLLLLDRQWPMYAHAQALSLSFVYD